MRGALPVLSTIVLLGAVIVAVEVAWPRPDFHPFLLRLEEWSAVRQSGPSGAIGGTTVWRLDYRRYDEWALTVVSDDLGMAPGQGNACHAGVYGYLDVAGSFHETSRDPDMCNGVGRWVHYGIAWSFPWQRHEEDGQIVYTDPGERVVFDARSGLPLLYEAGLSRGGAATRQVYVLERWLED